MLSYSQSTGALTDAKGNVLAIGYSGHGEGVNNPAMQAVADVGPIPRGLYSLGAPVNDSERPESARPALAHLGPFAIPLWPHDQAACCGRSGFFCHGDDVNHAGERIASKGCIIMPPDARHRMWTGGDHVLEVTE